MDLAAPDEPAVQPLADNTKIASALVLTLLDDASSLLQFLPNAYSSKKGKETVKTDLSGISKIEDTYQDASKPSQQKNVAYFPKDF